MIHESLDEKDSKRIAESFASKARKGDIFALYGDLGAGKTLFASAFINYFQRLEHRKPLTISSPTFNLVKVYRTNNFDIYHFDLYRLKRREELWELDLESAFQNVSLIEWPELIESLLPGKNIIKIKIEIQNDGKRLFNAI